VTMATSTVQQPDDLGAGWRVSRVGVLP
jgi:hypothetical protein